MYTYKDFLSKKISYGKELYEHELTVRQQAGSKFTPTVTIYTAFITAWIALFSSALKTTNIQCLALSDMILFILLFSVLAIIVVSISYFLRCYMNYKENIVSPEQVVNLFNNSENLIEDYKMGEIIDNIDSIMANSYFECAIHNFKQTTKKINLFNKAYFFMIIGICGLFIVFLFTVIR